MENSEMEEFINTVRERSDIYEVVSRYVPLNLKGGRFWACCPFHEEKTPSFTVTPEKGIFYCMCKDLISKKNIMISLMFPFFFIGVVTLVIGFIFNVPILIILSLFNIAGCAGDIAMFLSFLRLPSFSYIDLDDCTGYVLVSEYDLSNYRLFGMNLVECGKYDDSMRAKDFRKFTISKLSYVVFLIVIILFVFFNFM